MPSSKDSKTSKTAHVMNLLSRNRSGGEPETAASSTEAVSAAAAEPQAALQTPPKAAPVPPILTSLKADAEVSSQIKDALEAELEDLSVKEPAPAAEQAVPKPAPAPEPPMAAAPAAEPASVEAPALEEAPVPEAAVPEQPAAEIPAPAEPPATDAVPTPAAEAPVPEAPAEEPVPAEEPQSEEEEEPNYVNVMQVLVEEKAEKYMEMFGICRCGMCKADVKAYALNHLKPKYVVMGQREMIPKLTVYEAQNSSDITAEIIKACKVVMTTPHHTR